MYSIYLEVNILVIELLIIIKDSISYKYLLINIKLEYSYILNLL